MSGRSSAQAARRVAFVGGDGGSEANEKHPRLAIDRL